MVDSTTPLENLFLSVISKYLITQYNMHNMEIRCKRIYFLLQNSGIGCPQGWDIHGVLWCNNNTKVLVLVQYCCQSKNTYTQYQTNTNIIHAQLQSRARKKKQKKYISKNKNSKLHSLKIHFCKNPISINKINTLNKLKLIFANLRIY